jgi:hypothetical protein
VERILVVRPAEQSNKNAVLWNTKPIATNSIQTEKEILLESDINDIFAKYPIDIKKAEVRIFRLTKLALNLRRNRNS